MVTHTHTTIGQATRPSRARYPSLRSRRESAIVVSRNFTASQLRLFRAFTEPALLKRWWAPHGWSTPYVSVECRTGGVFHYCMRSPEGQAIWGRGIFREVAAPRRLVYVDAFADEEGNMVEPTLYGMSADHPREALVTITFAKIRGGSRLTLRHELPRSFKERDMMQQGWNEMLDRLDVLLTETAMEVSKSEHETIFTRLFAVPRQRLFSAWLDQELLAEWWGPHGFTNPVCITNPQPGGGLRIVMRSPQGIDQSLSGEYLEIDAPRRLVFTHTIDDAPAEFLEQLNNYRHGAKLSAVPKLTTTLLFEEQEGKTRLTLRTRFASDSERDAFMKIGFPEGMAQSLERLEELFGSCSLLG
ncbi:MAG TPA: SRPBCC family protein [Gammaproteobacteria bacterium]